MKKLSIAALCAAALVSAAFTLHAGDGPGHRRIVHHQMGGFGEELNLTADQKTAARQIHEEVFAKAEPLLEQHHQEMEKVHNLLDSGASATEVGEQMIAAHAFMKQIKALHEEAETRFAALLTPEQLAKFNENRENRKDHIRMRFHLPRF